MPAVDAREGSVSEPITHTAVYEDCVRRIKLALERHADIASGCAAKVGQASAGDCPWG